MGRSYESFLPSVYAELTGGAAAAVPLPRMVTNINYTAPQLSNKLLRHWAKASSMSFEQVLIGELREAVADQKGGLSHFARDMPSSMLTELFDVSPMDWPVLYFLVEK